MQIAVGHLDLEVIPDDLDSNQKLPRPLSLAVISSSVSSNESNSESTDPVIELISRTESPLPYFAFCFLIFQGDI